MSLQIIFPDGHTEIEPKAVGAEFWPGFIRLLDHHENPVRDVPKGCRVGAAPTSETPVGDFHRSEDMGDPQC